MTTAVVDYRETEQAQAWSYLDTSVLERRGVPEADRAVVEMAFAVGSAPLLHLDVRPKHLVAGWVPDPRGEQDVICTWRASVLAATP